MTIAEQEQQRYELMGAIAALAVIAYGADCIAVLEESLAEVQDVPTLEQCMYLTCDCDKECKRLAAGLSLAEVRAQ